MKPEAENFTVRILISLQVESSKDNRIQSGVSGKCAITHKRRATLAVCHSTLPTDQNL